MMPAQPGFHSYRSTVYARNGMVAASQPLAAQAGLRVLQQGGTAADAAVATAAALNVTEPTSTGIGGDAFMLYYDAATGGITALNGSGRAPAALTLDYLKSEGLGDGGGLKPLPLFHPHTVTVPGAAAAWFDTVEKFGRLRLTEILAPAIELAERGFPVAPLTAYFWGRGAERQLKHAPGGHQLLINGRAPRAGDIFQNPNLAATFRTLAEDGRRSFYEGAIAESIISVLGQMGGVMTLDDLAAHYSTYEDSISTVYHGVRVHECPPNGQGLAALLTLNILKQFDLPVDPLSANRIHIFIEALRLAFADARWYIADPAHAPTPLEDLLSEAYAADRAKLIDPDKATADQVRGVPVAGSDTVYLCAVDGDGNACSFINSNYMGFGTGIAPKGCGFTLQNRGLGFSLNPNHPNVLEPGKRPYHTIIPGLLTDAETGELVGPFGVMGGFMQPQGHAQVVVSLFADSLDPQGALDQPRFCIEDGTVGGRIALEDGIPVSVMSALADRGHQVRPVSGYSRAIFGRGQIILRNPNSGALAGGSDPRADGQAAGF